MVEYDLDRTIETTIDRDDTSRTGVVTSDTTPSHLCRSVLMVTLDYKLSTDWNPHELDLRAADEMTLRYDAFQGDIVFRVDDADFSAQWGWVPVLDFAMAMTTIAEGLQRHDRELFEFTESGATIHFQRDNGALMISASYAGVPAQLPLFEFSTAADDFLDRVKRELETTHPSLRSNELFTELG